MPYLFVRGDALECCCKWILERGSAFYVLSRLFLEIMRGGDKHCFNHLRGDLHFVGRMKWCSPFLLKARPPNLPSTRGEIPIIKSNRYLVSSHEDLPSKEHCIINRNDSREQQVLCSQYFNKAISDAHIACLTT